MVKSVRYYRGDIFYINSGRPSVGSEQRPGRPAVIVSNDTANRHSPNVTVVYLTTSDKKKPLPTHASLLCKVPSIALCEDIQTVSKERVGSFIKCCTIGEMRRIDECVAIALGLKHNWN